MIDEFPLWTGKASKEIEEVLTNLTAMLKAKSFPFLHVHRTVEMFYFCISLLQES